MDNALRAPPALTTLTLRESKDSPGFAHDDHRHNNSKGSEYVDGRKKEPYCHGIFPVVGDP
jgi:hypothetical protein